MTEEEIVNVEHDESEQEEPTPELVSTEPVPNEDEADGECKTCDVVNMMAVLGLAQTSCQLVEDQEQREKCIAWSEALDPKLIDSLEHVAEGIIEHAGTKSISAYSEVVNEVMHTAVIGYVQKKLDAGEPVEPDDLKLYKYLIVRRGV